MKSTRQEQIVRLISERGTISVEQASAEVDASPATIRRDFNDLAERGLVERVRGGVRSSEPGLMVPFAVREIQQVDEKLQIARRGAQLMSPGDVVFIDGGTTTLQLAACLPLIPLRIITNSLRFAGEIERRTQQRTLWEVFLTGGFLFPGSGLLVGPSAQTGLSQYHANWAMLSASGINQAGLFNDNEHVVESERVMIANADRVAVLADHTKVGRHAMCHIASCAAIDVLITSRHSSTQELEGLRSAGQLDLIVV